MAIEFHCPGCGKRMRTPDQSAGRKGRCPNCGITVQIPAASLVSSSSDSQAAGLSSVRPLPSADASNLQFSCSSCHNPLTVPAASAGKKGKCPRCGAVMSIPARNHAAAAQVSTSTVQVDSSRWKSGSAAPAPVIRIQFSCPQCGKPIKVRADAAGKQGQCPQCHAQIAIPATTIHAAKGTPTPRTQQSAPGLTPIDLSETPFGASNDPFGQLSALEQSASPFGSVGGSIDLSALPSSSTAYPASSSPASLNPYTSPATYSPSAASSQHAHRPKRNGLPWDRHVEGGFWETAKLVLFSSKRAFYVMHISGGFGRPMLYCVTGMMIGGAFGAAYNLLFQGAMLLVAGGKGAAMNVGFLIGAVIGMVLGLAIVAVLSIIVSFIYSAVLHVCLLVVGGARQPFETTYRICCYALGSSALGNVIPCLGGLVVFVFQLVTLIQGCWAGHEIALWKAVVAVLIPFIVSVIVLVVFAVMLISMLMRVTPAA